ncbi:MAG: hypothetical protein K2W95_29915 [Candidatus Obscuribacterales bacterium]|nr:hypothetical protein [Candidatus Obscuribacterales bacterium]
MTDFVRLYVPLRRDDGLNTAFGGLPLPASDTVPMLFLNRSDAVAALDLEPFAHPAPPEVPADDGSANPVDDGSTNPVDDGSANPVDDGSANPVDDGSANPVDDGSANPVDDGSANPVDNDGGSSGYGYSYDDYADDGYGEDGEDGDGSFGGIDDSDDDFGGTGDTDDDSTGEPTTTADRTSTEPKPAPQPAPPKLIRKDSSVVTIMVPRAMFDLMAADGTLLPVADGKFQLGDPDALRANTAKVFFESSAAEQPCKADGVTLYAAFCGEEVGNVPGRVGQDGACVIVSDIVDRCESRFVATEGKPAQKLRLYSTRDAAMATIKTIRPEDDVCVLMVTVSAAAFGGLIKTCTKYPRLGCEVPAALLPYIRTEAILTMELVQQGNS